MTFARRGEARLRYDRSPLLEGNDSLSEIARLVNPGSTVLDLGAATGKLGVYLRGHKDCVVDGVELDAAAAQIARPHYRTLLQVDLEKVQLGEQLPAHSYDAIVCADVLEHLRDPGRILEQLAPLLAAGGRVLISVPNIGYAGVVAELLGGEFKYRPTGLLDSTHLRFFTRRSLLDFLDRHGFGALSMRAVVLEPERTEFATTLFEQLPPPVRKAILDAPDALAYQFVIEAIPGHHAPQIVERLRSPQLRFGLQAFWAARDEAYDEKRSVAATALMGEWAQKVELRLPQLAGPVGKLRIDVADRPGFLHLYQISVLSSGGECLWVWDGNPSSLPARHDLVHFAGPLGSAWLSTSEDPYLELPLPPAALERISGGGVALELGWPASGDHTIVASALAEQESRWHEERKRIAARIGELEQRFAQAEEKPARAMEAQRRPADALEPRLADLELQFDAVRRAHSEALRTIEALTRRSAAVESALPWPALRAVLGLRRATDLLLRRRVELTPTPVMDVCRTDDGWQSTGTDPQFDLRPRRGRFPTGWVWLEFELQSEGAFNNPPTLFVDSGEGYTESNCIALPFPKDGAIRAIVKLPPVVYSIRFDPLDSDCAFRLGKLSVLEISKLEAGLRVLAPLAREVLGERGRLPLALSKAWSTWREGGVRGLKQRIRERTRASRQSYPDWVEQFDTLKDKDREAIRARVEQMERKPLFSVVMPVYETPRPWLSRAIESIRAQLYPNWELCIADDASKAPHVRAVLEEFAARDPRIKISFRPVNGHISECSNSALQLATGEFAVLFDHDDELPEHALYMLAEEMLQHPETDLIYSDEDKIDEAGNRYDPYFKPDWNLDLFTSQNYFSHLGAYRLSLLREVGGFRPGFEGSQDYDLALRCVARTQRVRHIPFVLYHWRAISGSTATATTAKNYAQSAAERALADHFRPIDPRIRVESGAHPTTYRVHYPVPDPAPLVSILIPTRDGYEVLHRCIESIYARTAYPRFEVVIVDNQSSDAAALRYFEELSRAGRARVIPYPHDFNFSAINNLAAREARGEVLCLLNNDVEVLSREWLDELASHALRPGVAAVGAKLLYPNDTIQHAGVVTGLYGVAGHVHRHQPRQAPGHFGRAQMVQQMTVVTGACLAIRKSVFEELHGLDEENLSVAFNDVDFCLRAIEVGYHNIYTPHAELYHHESYSRGSDTTPDKKARFEREIQYMFKRWGEQLPRDPCYNPNLSLFTEQFTLGWPPRVTKAWKRT
jgi:GT2 family glycosyltransferase/2-polyprenyl-3-methyl-5-hydroxy-6-metoxy-1,4-benzoquinol methylase